MSVIAMTMDDQRPLLNTYNNKMQEQQKYNEQQHINSTLASGPASPTPSGSEEPMSQQYHHQMTHYHHQHQHLSSSSSSTPTTQQHIYPKQHHYSTSTQRADNTKNVTDQKLQQQQQQQQQSSEEQQLQQQQQQQQHNVQPASVTCAVTVKAESVGVIDANHGQPLLEAEIKTLKEEQSRLAQQCADAQRREKILMRRLANKEQEFQDYVSQIAEYKAAQAPSAMALRSALLDPAVNLLFIKLKKELKTTKAKLEETQNELSAWKFTPDSNTGKRLMAKCRLLYQENEELGKMTSNGRLAKLETELSMQKSISKMLVQSQSELDEFLQELDEDVEGMQSTILLLQQELKTKSERIQALEKENEQFRQNRINNKSMTESNKDAMELQAEPPLNGDTQLTDTTKTTTTKQSTTTTTTMKQDVDVAAVKITAEPKSALAAYQEELAAAAKKDMEVCTEHIHKNAMNELSFVSQIKKEPEIQDDNMSTDINEVSSAASYYNGLPENLSLSLQTDEAVLNAARKRCLSDSSPVYEKVQFAPACGSYTPRTLPPKKSKLRLAPEDMSEQHDMLVNLPVAEEALSLVMDKEQVHSDMLAAGCEEYSDGAMGGIVGIGMAAQRILTRRRSMRQSTQPNGVIVSVGGVPAAENEIARETMLN